MSETIEVSLLPFHRQEIPVDRVMSLAALASRLENEDVKINKVFLYQNGFQILFKDIPGDAIIHDGSYASDWGYFETIGMPWNNGDVSVHSPKILSRMLGALKRGEDWEAIEKEEEE